jgi:hypothetical protein
VVQAPSTVVQLVLLVLLVLPGITYQFVRERLRGPVPWERDLGERVLRAVVASIALDAAYLTVAGPALIKLTRGTPPGDLNGFVQQPRAVGLVAVLLFLVVPGAAAFVVSLVERKRRKSTFQRTPTARDHAFRDRALDESIRLHEAAVDATPDGHPKRARRLANLGGVLMLTSSDSATSTPWTAASAPTGPRPWQAPGTARHTVPTQGPGRGTPPAVRGRLHLRRGLPGRGGDRPGPPCRAGQRG